MGILSFLSRRKERKVTVLTLSIPLSKGKRGKRESGKEKANYYGFENKSTHSTTFFSSSSTSTELQQMRALIYSLVVPGIREDLVPILDLTKRGSTVNLSDTDNVIYNSMNEKNINLWKHYGTCRLYLECLDISIATLL